MKTIKAPAHCKLSTGRRVFSINLPSNTKLAYAQLTLKEDNYANILLATFPLVNSTLVENENPVSTRNLFEGILVVNQRLSKSDLVSSFLHEKFLNFFGRNLPGPPIG